MRSESAGPDEEDEEQEAIDGDGKFEVGQAPSLRQRNDGLVIRKTVDDFLEMPRYGRTQ